MARSKRIQSNEVIVDLNIPGVIGAIAEAVSRKAPELAEDILLRSKPLVPIGDAEPLTEKGTPRKHLVDTGKIKVSKAKDSIDVRVGYYQPHAHLIHDGHMNVSYDKEGKQHIGPYYEGKKFLSTPADIVLQNVADDILKSIDQGLNG